MKHLLRATLIGAVLSLSFVAAAAAQEIATEKQIANLLVISEASYATADFLNRKVEGQLGYMSWNSQFTETSWTLHVGGESPEHEAKVSIAGYLWDDEDGNWTVSYSGTGFLDGEPVVVHGRGEYVRTEVSDGTSDFVEMKFSQLVKVGENSWWGWVKGTEVVFGGLLGGAGGVIAAPATAGASLVLGLAGAVGGAAAATSLSNEAKEAWDSDEPVPPPQAPLAPPPPDVNKPVSPNENQVMLAVFTKDGKIVGSARNGLVQVNAGYSAGKGTAGGLVEIKYK